MNKKLKTTIILISIFLVIIAINLFFVRIFLQKESLIEIIPRITGDERLDGIIFDNTNRLREMFGLSVLNEDSLINLVHIIKKKNGYEISCQLGPAYERANLNKFYPGEIVSMGQIKDCTIETAKVIDEAINSPEKDCRVPMEITGVFSSLSDYYLVTLDIKEHEITQEWLDKVSGQKCFEPLQDLMGENIAIEFITAIIDLKNNKIFY